MRADAIRMLLAAVDTMQPATYLEPHARDIHPADLPALLGISSQEARLILEEADARNLLNISDSGSLALTDLGRQELTPSSNQDALTPDLAYVASNI